MNPTSSPTTTTTPDTISPDITSAGATPTVTPGQGKRKSRKSPLSAAVREHLDTQRRAEVEGLLAAITDAVTALHTEPGWHALLRTAARLHTYSLGNQLLIAAARPDAQAVAGYRAWQALGRNVRKGEKGIRILRPITRTFTATDDSTDQAPQADRPQHEGTNGGRRVIAFGGVSVFEISQTYGPTIPNLTIVPLEGDAPTGVMDALAHHASTLGWTVRQGNSGRAEALANFRTQEIIYRADRPGAHTVVSIAHEIAHVHLHSPDEFNYTRCRGQAEIEAESVAYIVATALGVQAATPGSATYIASWAQDDNTKIRAAAERVTTTARTILATLTKDTGPKPVEQTVA